ncbi:hypothetical protein Taro_032093 [Colocasia esculenta]|uniref:F-box/kelch-repeat protein SKIP25 n=1 Tax=Colocasia esculenta TaxID=4460 RepID=A0A843VWC8_COLES|nr:hypothetical protein [Colocasia esculenta]
MACRGSSRNTSSSSNPPLSSEDVMVESLNCHRHQQQKKQKHHDLHRPQHQEQEEEEEDQQQPLLPGLPDHLAQLCLARLPPTLLFAVCRPWRRLLYSASFPPFLCLYALLSSPSSPSVELKAFDPVAGSWLPLPPPPPPPCPQLSHLLLRHPAFLSHPIPVQSVVAAGHLVLLAATTRALHPALPRPLAFDPSTDTWRLGPPLQAPRRWCAAGTAGGCVYVASGAGRNYSPEVARSVERWDISSGAGTGWERVAPLRDGRFSREAVEAVASRGKLCMVNVKGRAAKDGAVYDVAGDRWEEMPPGMLAGWTGPVAAAEDDEAATIYVVDEEDGELRAYDWERDAWVAVAKSERLSAAMQVAAGGGRVCVVCNGGDAVVVVDVATRPARLWAVEPPPQCGVVALHLLPRMSRYPRRR